MSLVMKRLYVTVEIEVGSPPYGEGPFENLEEFDGRGLRNYFGDPVS
jgi:hypothetical protein